MEKKMTDYRKEYNKLLNAVRDHKFSQAELEKVEEYKKLLGNKEFAIYNGKEISLDYVCRCMVFWGDIPEVRSDNTITFKHNKI
jgi:hypothetical protein